MAYALDMTGLKFSRLTVIRRAPLDCPEAAWLCVCDCGLKKIVRGSDLRKGGTKSCGCYRADLARQTQPKKFLKHGAFSGGRNSGHPRTAYADQKYQAVKRQISFLLSFEEWWGIWQKSGHWHERGTRKGDYVMARFGDKGPYAIGNVRITTVTENHSEFKHSKTSKRKMSIARRKQCG